MTRASRRRVLIVGGVAGGMSAATRLRRLDDDAEIVIFERGEHVSFANCGLPYYVGGAIQNRESLIVQTPESLTKRFGLDVHVRHDVVSVDASARTLRVVDTRTGEARTEPYDVLVLAPGARTRQVDSPGSLPLLNLRTVADADALAAALSSAGRRVVVVGGGYTGLEAAENLVARGASVTLVQRAPQLLSGLDVEMAAPVLDTVRSNGVDVRLGVEVEGIVDRGVVLSDGAWLEADLLVDAAGVAPEVALAADAGLSIGPAGGISVDSSGRTSDPHVFAVGDAAEKIDGISGEPVVVALAGLATRHGRMVADVISGRSETGSGALGTSIVSVFGLAAASVGWSEKRLRQAGRDFYVVHVHPSSHATYYPGAQPLAMKVIADPVTDRILGAQIVGVDGVDKRIDVISTAMHAALPAARLAQLELAYAPQFGSAKDAVNIAGYVLENTRNGTTPTVQWHELENVLAAGSSLIDVRSGDEHAAGAIPGAINIPLDELRDRMAQLPSGPLVVHCEVGLRGHIATRMLSQNGFSVRNVDGGYRTWAAGMR